MTLDTKIEVHALEVYYHPFYPRFLVEIDYGGRSGTVEIRAKCAKSIGGFTTNKEEQSIELKAMTISQVYAEALKMVKENEWLIEPK